MLLIGNGKLITQNPKRPFIEDGCVAVEGSFIKDFGTTVEMIETYPSAEFEDVGGRLIMPGLINNHTHIYSSFARGMSLEQPEPNRNFLEVLENMWWRMDKKLTLADTRYSAYATLLESVRNGVTTVFDHHASPFHIKDSLFTIGETAKELGIRASLCYEVSDRDGSEIAQQGIEENAAFIRYAEGLEDDMLKGMMGLHASFTLSDSTLDRAVQALEGTETGCHVHVAEGIDDLYDSLEKYGKRVVERLFDHGVLGEKSLAVHCIHINEGEMDILSSTNTPVIHNSESNMGNAVGCSAVIRMMEKGLTVGMGTDAYTQDMFESLKVANLIHCHHLCNPSVGFGQSLQMLFENNRSIAGRFFRHPLGIVKAGAYADLIVVDYVPHTPLNENTIGGHTMFGLMGRSVDSTMINGTFVMKERQMQTVDEEKILAESRAQAADFWKRV
ncbi:MAG: putative aminohydrolase SsnA [Oscillospiraceae bacterium]